MGYLKKGDVHKKIRNSIKEGILKRLWGIFHLSSDYAMRGIDEGHDFFLGIENIQGTTGKGMLFFGKRWKRTSE